MGLPLYTIFRQDICTTNMMRQDALGYPAHLRTTWRRRTSEPVQVHDPSERQVSRVQGQTYGSTSTVPPCTLGELRAFQGSVPMPVPYPFQAQTPTRSVTGRSPSGGSLLP